ncbi:MAG: CE1 family esterase [Thermoguttaceae bacterium]
MMRHVMLSVVLAGWVVSALGAAETPVRREWTVDGIKREALVYVPAAAATTPCPVVFAFHGHGGTMDRFARATAYHRLWPEAIAVSMQGLNTPGALTDPEGKKPGWQKAEGEQGDRDLKFFDAVLSSLKADHKVDEKRIYATGHSNGGGFTYLLWSARGDVFAAVAPCAAAALIGEVPDDLPAALASLAERAKKARKNLKPKPVLHMAGENDPLVRFSWQKRTIDGLLKLNGCGEGTPWGEHCTLYPSETGTPVVTYIHPGRHEVPPDVPAVIVKFFKDQAKPD